jgi:hypothetical protein
MRKGRGFNPASIKESASTGVNAKHTISFAGRTKDSQGQHRWKPFIVMNTSGLWTLLFFQNLDGRNIADRHNTFFDMS